MGRRKGRWAAVIVPAIVIGGLSWGGWRWWAVRRHRDAMARIEEAMQTGRYGVAARDLSPLLPRSPDPDRTAYLLGVREQARGRPQEADTAWARIPSDSPLIGQVVAGRMDLLLEQGRLADAEQLIESDRWPRVRRIGDPDVADSDPRPGRPAR